MAGLIVTWDGTEIQAIDEGNFESIVVEVIDGLFEAVEGYTNVEVESKAGSWDYGSPYKIASPPYMEIDKERYFIDIRGQSRSGEYRIDLKPSGLFIEKSSTGEKKELEYLTMRAPGVAVNPDEEELFVERIPEEIRKRVVESSPKLGSTE